MKQTLYLAVAFLIICNSSLSALPCCQRNCDEDGIIELYGEYLCWEAVQDQIPYVARVPGGLSQIISGIISGGIATPTITNIDIPFNWNSGFRVGLDYVPPGCMWDFQLAWTSLHQWVRGDYVTRDNSLIPINEPLTIALAFINRDDPSTFSLASEGKGSWQLKYDIVDMLYGTNFEIVDSLVIRPSIGVKMASISQNTFTQYFGMTLAQQLGPSLPVTINVHKKNKFLGAGPSISLDTFWQFARQWGLSGGIGGALVYGKFTSYSQPYISIASTATLQIKVDGTKHHRMRPTVDAYIGIDWNGCLCGQKIGVGLAYEWQYWWNQWQAPPSVISNLVNGGTSPQGDLMFQGITVRGSLFF